MVNTRSYNNSNSKALQKSNKINSIKCLIQEMGIVISDTGYVWTNDMRIAFNKAIKYLDKQDISLTS